MRAFVSIEIPEDIREKIKEIQSMLPKFQGKITEKENLHLTLKFLGELSDEEILKIRKRLRSIKKKDFDIKSGELGVFSENYVRIVWISLKGAEELQKKVDEELEDMFNPEERYMGHLTIARVKFLRNKKDFIDKLKGIYFEGFDFNANSFFLMSSTLTEKGPVYKKIEEYILEEK